MLPFAYRRAATVAEVAAAAAGGDVLLLAGGTEVLPWLRDGLAAPALLLDISRLPLAGITVDPRGSLRIGALTSLADVAADPAVRRRAPLLAQAASLSASPAIRHMGTLAGNLLQRTRCPYFRAGPGVPCNRRLAGSGCPARDGGHRGAAILGGSDACVAVHPSDPAVALVALDAVVEIQGPGGRREVELDRLYRLPGAAPDRDTLLEPGDLVTAVVIPAWPIGERARYLKLRERAGFDFALVACAAVVDETEARIALGGVAPKPWRCRVAEAALAGGPFTPERVRDALRSELAGAAPLPGNDFKVELAVRAGVRALLEAAEA